MVLTKARVHRQWMGFVIACALLAGSVACTVASPQDESGPEPTLGIVPTVDRPALVSRPVDAYLPSVQQVTALAQVWLTAMNNCLEKHGVSGNHSVSGEGGLDGLAKSLVDDRAIRGDLWGFFGDTAGTYGYGRPDGAASGLEVAPPPGVPDDVGNTCAQAGQDALGGHAWIDFAVPASLPEGGPSVPSSDSRWVAAVAGWSACMKDKGFSYDTPQAAIGDTAWRGAAVSAAQIATASADVACKVSTNLVGIGVAVQSAYDQQYIDAHRAELDAAVAQRDTYLRGGR